MAPVQPADPLPAFNRFIDFVHAADASTAEEDCLRRRLTIGRRVGEPEAPPPETALIPPRTPLEAGEVIDVRAETVDAGRPARRAVAAGPLHRQTGARLADPRLARNASAARGHRLPGA